MIPLKYYKNFTPEQAENMMTEHMRSIDYLMWRDQWAWYEMLRKNEDKKRAERKRCLQKKL